MCAVRCTGMDVRSANTASTRKKVFLGNFFAPAKKLPARKSGSFCSKAVIPAERFTRAKLVKPESSPLHRLTKNWIPAFAGMTSERAKAGFQFSLE